MVGQYGTSDSSRRKEIRDFYPTPDLVTEALLERESFEGLIWEPAAGAGHMSRVLERNHDVLSTDLRKEGVYGRGGVNFLLSNRSPVPNIVTNPPFNRALDFALHAKRRASHKIAFFLRLGWLEGRSRYRMFKDKKFPLKKVWIFSDRVTLSAEKLDTKGGGMIAFAWYVWEKGYEGNPEIDWICPARKARK